MCSRTTASATRAWARWRWRWRSEPAALVLAAALGVGCGGAGAPSPRPVARVGDLVLDAAVVEHIAARDGLSEADARERALQLLRLVAAGREAHDADRDDPGPVLAPSRAAHLRRAALARLWLHERFEPAHGPDDIPDDDPLLVRARADPRLVHPLLHSVCQVVVQPPDVEDLDAKAEITRDPAWRAAAERLMAPLAERIERNVPVGDPETCKLVERQIQLTEPPDDARLELSFPRPGGFDLDACAKVSTADGRCVQPRFDPDWTAQVRALDPPRFSAAFFTRFGLHLVYLKERLPARPAGDPNTERAIRESVLDTWRAERLDAELQRMGQARSVRMLQPEDDA